MSAISRAGRLALLGALALSCSERSGEGDAPLTLGQQYTTWFYAGAPERLWERFTPEMRETFGTPDSLAAYQRLAAAHLGPERGAPSEVVRDAGDARVYIRTASFERAPQPMVLEWTLTPDGQISGLFLAPAASDSTAPGDSAAQ